MSPNCSMICSEKKHQTSNLQHLNKTSRSSVFTCLLLHFSAYFPGWKKLGKRGRFHSFTCPQPEAKAPPPPLFTRGQGLRFTLHLYRFVDTPRLTDCDVDGGEGGPGRIFSPGACFWLGLGYFQLQVQLQMRRKSCFKIGDSEILNKNGLKQLPKN